MFRAAGVGGSQQILALLTPTSSGVRSALKREDVEYSLPLFAPPPDLNVEEEEDQVLDLLCPIIMYIHLSILCSFNMRLMLGTGR